MKKIHLLILSGLGIGFDRYRTANGKNDAPADPAAELADLKAKFEALLQSNADVQKSNADLQEQITALKNPPVTKPKLDLGPFALPAGIDEEDVIWRMKGGLDAKQAVQAAIQQQNHENAEAEKAKVAEAKAATAATAASAAQAASAKSTTNK